MVISRTEFAQKATGRNIPTARNARGSAHLNTRRVRHRQGRKHEDAEVFMAEWLIRGGFLAAFVIVAWYLITRKPRVDKHDY
jgi:hypothetical protein